jgi:hypothetical protein
MFGGIVEHVAALAQRGEIAGGIVARIMVEVRAGEHDIGGAHPGEQRNAALCSATRRPSPSRQPRASPSHQRPSPRCATWRRCGRRQRSQRAPARTKRIARDTCGQSIG